MKMSRVWAMPNHETFSIPPIREFVQRYMQGVEVSVDPFARKSQLATYTNDLNPEMPTQYHLPAEAFLAKLADEGVKADLVFFDPPYSPRQMAECYVEVGIAANMTDTQNAALYRRVREQIVRVLKPRGRVLSFGWNSTGMGKTLGFEQEEILLVCHGGGHNDTICVAERWGECA